MMHALIGMLQALGLSTASGFNAYVPLLVVGVLARFGLIQLTAPYDLVAHPLVLVLLVVVGLLDFVADKVPVLDHLLHIPGLLIHPAAGVVLSLLATSDNGIVHPAVFAVIGLFLSGGLHLGRTSVRAGSTATTGGLANPLVSFCEDCVSVVLAVLAVVAPILAAIFMVLVIALFVRFIRKRLRARRLRLASTVRRGRRAAEAPR
jgi:hypothetical protein